MLCRRPTCQRRTSCSLDVLYCRPRCRSSHAALLAPPPPSACCAAGRLPGEDISWNFEKFLLDKYGHPVKRYASGAFLACSS